MQGPGRPGVYARPARCQGTVCQYFLFYLFLLYDQVGSFGLLTGGKLYQLVRELLLFYQAGEVLEDAVGRSGVVR